VAPGCTSKRRACSLLAITESLFDLEATRQAGNLQKGLVIYITKTRPTSAEESMMEVAFSCTSRIVRGLANRIPVAEVDETDKRLCIYSSYTD
jgi:hypothetical protein